MTDNIEHRFERPTDSDGYLSFQCPFCAYRFELSAAELTAAEGVELYCPACGLSNTPDTFATDEVKQYALEVAKSMIYGKINTMFDDFARTASRNKNITVKRGSRLPDKVPSPPAEPEDLSEVSFTCCGHSAKVDIPSAAGSFYCPYCGVKQP